MSVTVTFPGVFVEEIPSGTVTITGVATSITAFVGRTLTGPTEPIDCFNYADFTQHFGGRSYDFPLSYAVEDFFQNGGGQAIIVRVLPAAGATGTLMADDYVGDAAQLNRTGIYALDRVDLFNLLCIPWDQRGKDLPDVVYRKAAEYCVKRRAMLILDPPSNWIDHARAGDFGKIQPTDLNISSPDMRERNCAVYFPRVKKADSERGGSVDVFPACGIIAGVMATTDANLGVWKAPAGITASINGIVGLEMSLTDDQNGVLNRVGINCLRTFPMSGPVVWGARTLQGADFLGDDYKYISVRRFALFIEESLDRGTKFAVFEPNDETLWSKLRLAVGAFMADLWRQGALFGAAPSSAYAVACDQTTTTQSDIDRGIVNIVIFFAPLKPAEFVALRIQQQAGQTPRQEPPISRGRSP
jgi:phage tail sheath protein FI